CLCAALADTVPCFCGIVVGNDIPLDYAGECAEEICGAAYVRVINAFPSTNFPEQDTTAGCVAPMAYSTAVGVIRWASIGGDRGELPSPEEIKDLSMQLLSDMNAIRTAIRCCLASSFEDLDYVLGQYAPLPAEGGVAGGETNLTIGELY